MVRKVTINLKQKVSRNTLKGNSKMSVSQKDKMKFKIKVPGKITINLKQTSRNNTPGFRVRQGGSVKLAYNNKSNRSTNINISQVNGDKPTVKKV